MDAIDLDAAVLLARKLAVELNDALDALEEGGCDVLVVSPLTNAERFNTASRVYLTIGFKPVRRGQV